MIIDETINEVLVFETSDGVRFNNREAAEEHIKLYKFKHWLDTNNLLPKELEKLNFDDILSIKIKICEIWDLKDVKYGI